MKTSEYSNKLVTQCYLSVYVVAAIFSRVSETAVCTVKCWILSAAGRIWKMTEYKLKTQMPCCSLPVWMEGNRCCLINVPLGIKRINYIKTVVYLLSSYWTRERNMRVSIIELKIQISASCAQIPMLTVKRLHRPSNMPKVCILGCGY